jgi:glycosyltransferase involved in cell wall biosynthesis
MGKTRILHVVKRYSGNYPLINSMILDLDGGRFDAKACYLSGEPDGANLLDGFGKAIYFKKNAMTSSVAALTRLLKKEQPALVHCHRHKPTVCAILSVLLAGSASKTKVISHVHGLNRTRSFSRRLTNWLLLKHAAIIIAVSESVNNDVLQTNWGVAPEKVVTVWNGIDLTSIDTVSADRSTVRMNMGIPRNAFVFGSVGRLVKTKGYRYFLKSFAEIRSKMPDAKIVLIGEGALKGELEKQTLSLGITGSVLFPGFRDDIPELITGFDVFVLPSLAEGLSLALLEAMASRLPVIASDVGGIPEVLNEPGHGLLVRPRDSESLSAAMEKIYNLDPDERQTMGEAARKRIEDEFSAAKMCRNLTKVYESIL